MKDHQSTIINSRRAFMATLAMGAGAGLSAMTDSFANSALPDYFGKTLKREESDSVDKALRAAGKLEFPVAFDGSQANPWPIIWSNVYYITNEASGTANKDLGVVGVLRHSGILFTFKDELIKEYGLSKVFGFVDPETGEGPDANPFWEPAEGTLPPGLTGVKGLMEKGQKFYACDMAYRHYSGEIAKQKGLKAEDVYNDFVAHKHEGIELAPSGVWVLGRMATYGISYIDASVG